MQQLQQRKRRVELEEFSRNNKGKIMDTFAESDIIRNECGCCRSLAIHEYLLMTIME